MLQIARLAIPEVPRASVRRFDNGVRAWSEGRTDVYELPTATEGVPRRISIEHRHWWQGGDRLRAVDAQGQSMKIRSWDTDFYVTDARSGISTRLSPEKGDLVVQGPSTSKSRPILNGAHRITQYVLEQHLRGDGDMRILTNRRVEEKTVAYGMVRDMPANMETTIQHDEDYEETLITHDGETPQTHRWHEEKYHERKDLGTVPSRLDQSGDLSMTDASGAEKTWHLFIAPHAMAQA